MNNKYMNIIVQMGSKLNLRKAFLGKLSMKLVEKSFSDDNSRTFTDASPIQRLT